MNTTPPVISATSAKAILAASPVTLQPSAPGASGVTSWIPPRNIWVGGVAGIVAWLILHGLAAAGLDIGAIATPLGFSTEQVQGWIAAAIAAGIATYVPPSVGDIIKHLNDTIVHIAQRDPATNVSYVITPVTPPIGEPATIVPPAPKE